MREEPSNVIPLDERFGRGCPDDPRPDELSVSVELVPVTGEEAAELRVLQTAAIRELLLWQHQRETGHQHQEAA